MTTVQIFWDPQGHNLDSLGRKKFLRATDGDTPFVEMSIRMLSIDTPEVHYPGNAKPSNQDANLAQLAQWIQQGKAPIDADLAAFIAPKLATGSAGTLQQTQGQLATTGFKNLLSQRLTRPSGTKRRLFIRSADDPLDQYGRLLAYIAPSYSAKELRFLSRKQRATFNLLMVEAGWAATLAIYPSLPRYDDLVLLQQAAESAIQANKGFWADPLTLTGYEFRMCVKLYGVTKKLVARKSLSSRDRYGWISRYCLDMTTREVYRPQDYHKVEAHNRIFIWPEDVGEAVGAMNLVPS